MGGRRGAAIDAGGRAQRVGLSPIRTSPARQRESVIGIPAGTGRLLTAHGPALLARFIAGTLGHYLVLEPAGLVGARTARGGILLLPVASLSLLVAHVAMLLVLRDAMPHLRALAPLPADPRARRSAFLDGVLGGILPFVAFHAAWGLIRQAPAARSRADRDRLSLPAGSLTAPASGNRPGGRHRPSVPGFVE